MTIATTIRDKRAGILARWTELAFQVYPPDTIRFLNRERDRFQNPVGHATRGALELLLDGLAEGRPAAECGDAIDEVIRIRAVQDMPASRALEFVFQLKQVLREALGAAADSGPGREALRDAEDRVDRLGLVAFDVYLGRRVRLHELRADEARRRTSALLRRLTATDDPAESDPDNPGEKQLSNGGSGA